MSPSSSQSDSSLLPSAQTSMEKSFHGFENDEIRPSLLSLLTLTFMGLLLQAFPLPLGSILSCFIGALAWKWYHIHGMKLTRREIVFFDEKNLLEISAGCDYSNPLAEDAATPITGPPDVSTRLIGTETIWEALFCDEQKLNMQKFYREHYGPVWMTTERSRKAREEMKGQTK